MSLIAPHRDRPKFTIVAGEGRSWTEAKMIETRGSRIEGKMPKKRIGGPLANESKPAMIPDVVLDDLAALRRMTTALLRDFLDGLLSGECKLPVEENLHLFVELLGMDDYPELRCGAASALINFARATSENVSVIIRGGAVPIFVRLLASAIDGVRFQAVQALSSIPCDSLERLELVLRSGALTPSFKALYREYTDPALLEYAAAALSSFFGGSLDWTKASLPALKNVIHSSDDEVRANAFWALVYHSDTDDKLRAVVDEGFCPILVEHFTRGPSSVSFAALAAVVSIVWGDRVFIQAVLEHGALPRLKELLTRTDDRFVKREACFVLSRITLGTKEQIRAVVEAGLISSLVNLINGGGGLFVMMHAARAIANATNGSSEDISRLVSEGGIKPLCDLLTCSGSWNLLYCLGGLERILEAGELRKAMSCSGVNEYAEEIRRCGGLEEIRLVKEMLFALDCDVNGRAAEILEKYWGE